MPKPDLQNSHETDKQPSLLSAACAIVQGLRDRLRLAKQPSIYQKFNRRRKDYFEFPIYKAQDVLKNYNGGEDEFNRLHNCIVEVDFSETPSFRDPDTALMCVVVLASDGQKGSFTHLTIPQTADECALSVTRFVGRLSGYWDKQVPVCLVGGVEYISKDYFQHLIRELISAGFIVSEDGNELGGEFMYRKVTLFPDKVFVKRNTYSENLEPVTLEFPKQECVISPPPSGG